ncbi:hypothetical protein ECDEC10C_0004 [Escherichia coli DEC10C]|nr:hypothetical protein ECDEC10C_0004 [Escherichia coli DEC10C]
MFLFRDKERSSTIPDPAYDFPGLMYFCQPAGGTDTKLIHVME